MSKFRFGKPKKEEGRVFRAQMPSGSRPLYPKADPPPTAPTPPAQESANANAEAKPKMRFEVGKEEEQRSGYQQDTAIDTNIVQKVDAVIEQALEQQATDVHFEPTQNELVVRIRLHGALKTLETFPEKLQTKIINRIKVLSGMDITKNKLPQSGFFKVVTEEAKTEILTATFPTLRGEKATLKIQYQRGVTHTLEQLGMNAATLEQYQTVLKRTNGLIIVAGPPGNGKTTTLYATLHSLNNSEKSVATFEKVVKYEIPGIIQGKPDLKADFPFEQGVRSIIDIEPDILLIGEVQSPQIAKSIVQAAFAKRIVMARMSADNSVNAIQNLIDMGLQPFLVTSAINCVLAQRLVRKLCDACKERYTPPPQLLSELELDPQTTLFRARGCENCQQTGYDGNVGIFELLVMKEELSEMIIARESPRHIREAASKQGLMPLKNEGITKAIQGITSIQEVLNAI